jgi:hypothetical protein
MDEEILVASDNSDEVDIEAAAAAKTTVHNGVRGAPTGQNR